MLASPQPSEDLVSILVTVTDHVLAQVHQVKLSETKLDRPDDLGGRTKQLVKSDRRHGLGNSRSVALKLSGNSPPTVVSR
jgi:hypothetical protein